MALLTIVRHGQSIYNLQNRFTGSVDVELSPQGVAEALQAGKKLMSYHYSAAYTSSLTRAQQTLTLILNEINQQTIPIIKNKALDERMYGSLQGLNKEETIAKYGENQVNLWRRSFAVRPPEGESLEDTFNRTVPYYRTEIEPRLKSSENILLVAHGNSLRALVMYLELMDENDIANLNIPTGTPKNYVFDDDLKITKTNYL